LVVHARYEGIAHSQEAGSSASPEEIDKSRIEAMNRLVSALKGNVRVRYEIDVTEVISAYVICS
jgi:rapamycin-insensitive companion of mTOR